MKANKHLNVTYLTPIKVKNLGQYKVFRRDLRKRLTPAEARLWSYLKNSKLDGRKFRRQQSIGKYVLDFYCPQEKLAIELDGAGHFTLDGAIYDTIRDNYIRAQGIKVIRFENKLVFEQYEYVLENIRMEFKK